MPAIGTGTGLSIASIATGALGGITSGIGKIAQGREQQQADDYNAAITLQNTAFQIQGTEEEFTTLTGKQATHYAKAGVDIASGSPLLVMAHTAALKGQQEASQAQAGDEQSALQRYYGRLAAFNGTAGGIGDFFSAASKGLIQGAGVAIGP